MKAKITLAILLLILLASVPSVLANPMWAHDEPHEIWWDINGWWVPLAVFVAIMVSLGVIFLVYLMRQTPTPPFTEEQEKRIQELIKLSFENLSSGGKKH